MDVFTLAAKLTLETGEFSAELAQAESEAKGFGSSKVWKTIGKAAAGAVVVAGAGVAKAIKSSVETGMQFDAMMSEVQAVSGATGHEFDILRARAQELGATTKFTATEAAEAFYYMGLAGWDVEEMLDGIGPVLSLAAASGEDLGRTSDIVTDALTALGYKAKDAAEFADVLAAAATKSNTTVGMMGEAFKYLATTGGVLGYSMEDVAVTLGLLANNGIKAGQAGTSMRQILNTLVNPTDKAAEAMDALGIRLFEEGTDKRIPLLEVLQNIREVFKDSGFNLEGFSPEELNEQVSALNEWYDAAKKAAEENGKFVDEFGAVRTSAEIDERYKENLESLTHLNESFLGKLGDIGGLRGISSLFAIMNSTDEDFNQLVSSVYDSEGKAQEMAETMLDNLKGDITILNSAIDGLKLVVSDEFKEPFRNFVQVITTGISDITQSIRENGLAKGLWSWLIGDDELDLINDRLENDMNDAEVNAVKATALTEYLQTLVDKYGEAATKTEEWKTATSDLELVMPGVSEQLTAQGATLQENLDKVIAMKDEMRNMAIQQAMGKALDAQYEYLGEQTAAKAQAEIRRDMAQTALGTVNDQMVEMIRAYSAEELRLAQAYNSELEKAGYGDMGVRQERLDELQSMENMTAEQALEAGKSSADLIEMAKETLASLDLAYASYAPDEESFLWDQSAADNLLTKEQLDAIGDQMDAYKNNLDKANAEIEEANKAIEDTEEQIRVTEAAIKRTAESLQSSGNDIDTAGANAATDISNAGDYLSTAIRNAAPDAINYIPHAKGAASIPYDNYPALLHRGEMVLTASQARKYRDGQGGFSLASIISAVAEAVRAGLEQAQFDFELDGDVLTRGVIRRQTNDAMARRFVTV